MEKCELCTTEVLVVFGPVREICGCGDGFGKRRSRTFGGVGSCEGASGRCLERWEGDARDLEERNGGDEGFGHLGTSLMGGVAYGKLPSACILTSKKRLMVCLWSSTILLERSMVADFVNGSSAGTENRTKTSSGWSESRVCALLSS